MSATQIINLQSVQHTGGLTGQTYNREWTVTDIVSKAVNQPTAVELEKQERLAMLSTLRITTETEVEPEQFVLKVDDVGIFALRDIHAIKGKQKSGKSSVMKVMMGALLGGSMFRITRAIEDPVVLFLDTEQKAEDVKLVIGTLKEMTHCSDDYINSHLYLYNLRRLSCDTLLADTRLLIWRHRPQVVFIDGLVDYVESFNDEVLSRHLIRELLVLCDEFNCSIVNALHENKSIDDDNMRGHLGTNLAHKAANVLQCRKKSDGLITVSCPDSRHEAMPEWSIIYDEEGHIVDADAIRIQQKEAAKKEKNEQEKAEWEKKVQHRQDTAFALIREHSGCMLRRDLYEELQERLKLSPTTVSRIVTQMEKEGKLFASGKKIMEPSDTLLPV